MQSSLWGNAGLGQKCIFNLIYCSVKAGGAFKASEWGGKICDVMAPAPEDVVVEGKRGL